jgi:hypothetical protein
MAIESRSYVSGFGNSNVSKQKKTPGSPGSSKEPSHAGPGSTVSPAQKATQFPGSSPASQKKTPGSPGYSTTPSFGGGLKKKAAKKLRAARRLIK